MSDNATLAARIQRLEDLEAIKRVTADYADCVNHGWSHGGLKPDSLRQVMTADVVWEAPAFGMKMEGIDEVVKVLGKPVPDICTFAMHSFTNPQIDVDDDTATGNWLIWVAVVNGGRTDQYFQSERLNYVRYDNRWLIRSIALHYGTSLFDKVQ